MIIATKSRSHRRRKRTEQWRSRRLKNQPASAPWQIHTPHKNPGMRSIESPAVPVPGKVTVIHSSKRAVLIDKHRQRAIEQVAVNVRLQMGKHRRLLKPLALKHHETDGSVSAGSQLGRAPEPSISPSADTMRVVADARTQAPH